MLGHRIVRHVEVILNVYPASKYAVTAITSTLETELLGTKIRTTVRILKFTNNIQSDQI